MFSAADSDGISQVASIKENTSNSISDARESTKELQITKAHNREITLKMLLRELLICTVLAITTYGALNSTPTKISKPPEAKRFFNRGSIVIDWYEGQLSRALAAANQADVAFIMYYAPWDAESQYVRDEFEKTAKLLGDRVHFSAINCWHPGSSCRQRSNIPSWPVLTANTKHSNPFIYKGPKEALYMVKFLELVMTPLKRITTAEELVSLMSICDIVAVGYTPLHNTPKYYNIWNSVAVQARGYDVVGEICFAVVTSEQLATELGVENLPSIKYMMWNETKEYDTDIQKWNASLILPWVLSNFRQPVEWVIPRWTKSYTFERITTENPTLIMFTPLNPLFEQIPMYALFREIAIEYYNCLNNKWLKELVKLKQIQRLVYQEKSVAKFCNEFKQKTLKKTSKRIFNKVLSKQNKYPWSNSSVKSEKTSMFGNLFKYGVVFSDALSGGDEQMQTPLNYVQECTDKVLLGGKKYNENYEQCDAFDDVIHEKKFDDILDATKQPEDSDPLSADHLLQRHIDHYCKLYKFANQLYTPLSSGNEDVLNITYIHGLACKTNVSLNIVAMDSLREHHFAESLGIDILNIKDNTALVILDSKFETQHVLKEEVSAKSIREFIINFTNKKLSRKLRSKVENSITTHNYDDNNEFSENYLKITELTSKTFRRFVNTPKTISLMCICGGVCPALVNRALMSATRMLASCGVRIQASVLDALRHDMPWQYTPSTYPTIFAFPADRHIKSESKVYPSNKKITGSGIVSLVLHMLPTPEHLRVRLVLCSYQWALQERASCLKDLKQHVVTLINNNLKYWRIYGQETKNIVYERLLIMRNVSFELERFHVNNFGKDSERQGELMHLLNYMSRFWYSDSVLLESMSNNRKIDL